MLRTLMLLIALIILIIGKPFNQAEKNTTFFIDVLGSNKTFEVPSPTSSLESKIIILMNWINDHFFIIAIEVVLFFVVRIIRGRFTERPSNKPMTLVRAVNIDNTRRTEDDRSSDHTGNVESGIEGIIAPGWNSQEAGSDKSGSKTAFIAENEVGSNTAVAYPLLNSC